MPVSHALVLFSVVGACSVLAFGWVGIGIPAAIYLLMPYQRN